MWLMSASVDGASVLRPRRARPRHDQHRRARRVGRDHGQPGERGRADEQQLPAADAVAQRTHGDQEAAEQEAVAVHDPELLGAARVQGVGDARQGQQHHEHVDRDEQRRQASTARPIHSRRPARSLVMTSSRGLSSGSERPAALDKIRRETSGSLVA